MNEIKTIFCDIGGVLLTNGWDADSRRLATEQFNLDWEDFEDRHEFVVPAFDAGRLTLDEYLNRTLFYRPRPFSREEFKTFMYTQSRPFAESLSILKQVRGSSRYLMAALNNESLELNQYRIEHFRLRDYFSIFLSSCFLGLNKPDEAIYRLALLITQCPPGDCLFIDDRVENVEAAQKTGMRTILFQTPEQLRLDLERAGILR